ncbi:serine/threonine-protein kinase [Eggerthella sinensis]|uniref:serine/threonine-protein kinase n=1 Tax=Eggerthella sinensis TaxID=242230 RepID=UPI0022E7E675|nr:serine/threonine-protein kinase [Eggerthella sinensis]
MARDQQLILNRYRPIGETRAGGFGTVRVAWDTRIQRKVAIKCIELDEVDVARAALPGANAAPVQQHEPLPWEDDPVFEDADDGENSVFDLIGNEPLVHSLAHLPGLDEARTAAMLSDSNIVAVYDFEVQESTAYLIMEYVEGLTLTELLHRHADRLTLDIAAAVFAAVSHALEVAHANQVLHLDIKPDNVLINHQGQVKVTDFGLATLADASGYGTAGGGTIGYMPLEQMRQENLDVRCDEWALASLTYEMLAGENPFLAPDLARAEDAIEDAELVLPSLCWDELDPAVDDVIFFALDPDREERYASVADFAEELEPFLGDPKRGVRELAVIVGHADDEEEEEVEAAPPVPRIPLRERITELHRRVAAHAVGAVGSGAVAFVAFSNLPQTSGIDNPLFWGLLALVALAGALKPHSARCSRTSRCRPRSSPITPPLRGACCLLQRQPGGTSADA